MNVKCINIAMLPGNTVAPPLTMNKVYAVKEKFICKCGQTHYDVGLKTNVVGKVGQYHVQFVTCYKCREQLPFSGSDGLPKDMSAPVWWTNAIRFNYVSG